MRSCFAWTLAALLLGVASLARAGNEGVAVVQGCAGLMQGGASAHDAGWAAALLGVSTTTCLGTTSSTAAQAPSPGLDRARHLQAQNNFARINDPILRLELATGGGEYLKSFARLLGCTPDGVERFVAVAAESAPRLLDLETTADNLAERLRALVQGDDGLHASCPKT